MTILRVLALAALMASGAALAQDDAPTHSNTIVYKCVNADGTIVYSDNPCSTDPKKMVTLDTAGALRTGSGGHQEEIAASVADSNCRDNAFRSTHSGTDAKVAGSNAHIAEYRQRRETLQSQVNYAGGGADDAMSKSINELDAAIAQESEFQQKEIANAALSYEDALKLCDQQRRNGGPVSPNTAAGNPAEPVPMEPLPPPPEPEPAPATDNGG